MPRRIVKTYDARDPLPPNIARYISAAHYRRDGCMYSDYQNIRENQSPGSMVLVCLEDKKPVGWCLYVHSTSWHPAAEFWTSRKHRRKGVGTKLYKELKKHKKKFRVFLTDTRAREFFKSTGRRIGSDW